MALRISINNSAAADLSRDYVTWTPTPCRLISTEPIQRTVILRNRNPSVGKVVFRNSAAGAISDTIQITIPAGGTANFFIAGRFGSPSRNDKDCRIQIVEVGTNINLGEKALMVRVRKNANNLTAAERNRFLDALVRLNSAVGNIYVPLQNMHVSAASSEIHGRSCFLPWHRGYLLDLERKLQRINPAITIPYWKFDAPSPNVFTRDFMGLPNAGGIVEFSATNPMINWRLQVFGVGPQNRIRRVFVNGWNPNIQAAINVQRNENQTLNISNVYSPFRSGIEGDPHGGAHVSFDGQVSDIGQAPADPLFFMLHANVDRLWAKWQLIRGRFNPALVDSYDRQGNGNAAIGGNNGIGNFTNDTMWPWNGVIGNPRPNTAPGGGLPATPIRNFPGTTPRVSQMMDYHGRINLNNDLMFAYDDVPF